MVLFLMVALQVVWVVVIWATGTAEHAQKLPVLIGYSLLCGVLVAGIPTWLLSEVGHRTGQWCDNPLFIRVACGVVVILGVMYAYWQRGWPDEPMVFAAAQRVAEQGVRTFFATYAQIPWLGTQHPPLVVLIYGGAFALFGPHLFVIRLVALGFSLGLLFLTYRIGYNLYDRTTGLWAAGALLVTPFFFRIGTTALNDMPVAFWFTLAVFLTLRLLETPTYRLALELGLCIGAGLLCKYTMLLVYPVVLIVVILKGQWRLMLTPLAGAAVVSLVIFGGWLVTAAQLGVFAAQQQVLSGYAGHVLATSHGKRWLVGVLTLRLPSGIGVYMLPLLFVGFWHLLKQRSPSDLVIVGWALAVFLPLIFMLPGPRYFLPAFPALAMMMARGLMLLGEEKPRVALMAFLSWGGALYLFVDWYRAAGNLFLH